MTKSTISRSFLLGSMLLVLLWLMAIVTNSWEKLRGDYGWRWGYVVPDSLWRIVPLALILIVYLLVSQRLMTRNRARLLIGWTIVGGIALILAALYVQTPRVGQTLYLRTLSSGATGWHFAGVEMDKRGADEMLETWPDVMDEFKLYSAHVAISPPGMAIAYHETNQLLEKTPFLANWAGPPLRAEQCHDYRFNENSNAEFTSTGLGILSPLWTALTVIPLYLLGRRYFSEGAARWAILWWPLIPAVLMFQPYPSVIYPALTIPMILALMNGLTQSNRWWMLGAGMMMSVASFMNFSILPLLLVAGLLALGIYFSIRREKHLPWWWPLAMGIWYGVGLITVWIVYYGLYSVTFFDVLNATFSAHLDLDRPYLPWLFLHLYDFAFFLGWPLLLMAGLWFWRSGKSLSQERAINEGSVLGIAILVTLIILTLSGTARGETGRVWLFFMPYMLLMAGMLIDQTKDWQAGWLVSGVQSLLVVGLVTVIPTIGTGLNEPPPTPTWEEQSSIPYLANGAIYDDTIRLQEFSGHIDTIIDDDGESQNVLKIWVRWTSTGYVEKPYYLGILPVAPDGTAQKAYVAQPFADGDFAMTCWLPERGVIEDFYVIPIVGDLAGDWWVSIQILERQGTALSALYPDGTTDVQVGIGPFKQLDQ